ncbi:MAG: class I SAM-dependent methyltransferase [Candidatus Hydrogenedentes bacterium]|nr:class I SAM-dependent methyltransferase [Candidatus Hydrogenedentota bacterium]
MKQDSEYWDGIAPLWTQQIFNTLRHDRNRVIVGELERAARTSPTVADFGCGVGTYLPTLSRLFEEVHGYDHSRACVEMARRRMRRKRHVSVHQAATVPRSRAGAYDTVLCVNVAINPNRRAWYNVLRSAASLLRPNGKLLLVVPSVESATLIAKAEQPEPDTLEGHIPAIPESAPSAAGIVSIEGVRTKHYTRTELTDTLAELGLQVARVRRVEYSWRSQAVSPPRELRNMRPWDWLAVARNASAAAVAKAA